MFKPFLGNFIKFGKNRKNVLVNNICIIKRIESKETKLKSKNLSLPECIFGDMPQGLVVHEHHTNTKRHQENPSIPRGHLTGVHQRS